MRTLILSLLALTLSFATASAEDRVGKCVYEHQACATDCLGLDSEGSQAACVAKCAGIEAQCVSVVGIKQSQPYLREKADQLEGMIQEFFGDILPTPAPETEKPSTNSET